MIVMLSQMAMLITKNAVIKSAFLSKTETAHQFHGFPNKFGIKTPAVAFQKFHHLIDGHMLFGL